MVDGFDGSTTAADDQFQQAGYSPLTAIPLQLKREREISFNTP
jgi:hypothetical protein